MKTLARILAWIWIGVGWIWVGLLGLICLGGIVAIIGAISNGESWVGGLLMVLISACLIVASFVMPRLIREHRHQE